MPEAKYNGPVTIRGSKDIQPAEITPEAVESMEKMAVRPAAEAAEAAAILARLNPGIKTHVVAKEIEVAGVPTLFHIKQFSAAESAKLDAKKYRRSGNQIVKDLEYEETWGNAYLIQAAVLRNDGTEEEPVWVPLFTLDQVYEPKKGKGLMDNGDPNAKELLNNLQAAIWEVNRDLNPLVQAIAMQQMGLAPG